MAGADDMVSSFFFADPTGQGMTYEQLKARRALAAALAAKSRDYPNTLGKGIFSLGESIGGAIGDYQLNAEERRIRAGDKAAYEKNKGLLEADPGAATTPPVGAPGPAAAPAPRAELDPSTDLSRAQIAQALTEGAQGSQPAGPAPVRMAALPQAGGIMSDAGQPGLTYGGPSPAGPGASMAERPDQAPPAPSAPPPTMAGQIPGGTPGPQPVAGGGVPAGPGPLPPGVDAARAGLAQQIAGENQAFNPDAAGPGGPGAGVSPQMLAQVGGFGGAPPGGAVPYPAPPPGGLPPGAMGREPRVPGSPGYPLPPGGVRPDTSRFTPPTEAEFVRQYGQRAVAPSPWPDPGLRTRYNQAINESLNPDRSDAYRSRMKEAAGRIKEENDRLFTQKEGLYKQKVTQEGSNYETLRKEAQDQFNERTDPAKIAARDQTIADHQLSLRAGNIPAAEVHKELKSDQETAKATAQRLEDYMMARDAMNSGVFVGAGSATRLDTAKFAAWLTNNKALSERAGSTELLKAKLLSTVNGLVKDIKPVSNIDIMLGKQQAGDINMEPGAISALLNQTLQHSYRDLADYDSKAHSLVNGLGQRPDPNGPTALESRYKSPDASWIQKTHANRLTSPDNVNNPAALADFDARYGPGAAAFAINRQKLRQIPVP
jgi:hypothetical protein